MLSNALFFKPFIIPPDTYLYANLRSFVNSGVKLVSAVVSSGYFDLAVKLGERFLLCVLCGFRIDIHRSRYVFVT